MHTRKSRSREYTMFELQFLLYVCDVVLIMSGIYYTIYTTFVWSGQFVVVVACLSFNKISCKFLCYFFCFCLVFLPLNLLKSGR